MRKAESEHKVHKIVTVAAKLRGTRKFSVLMAVHSLPDKMQSQGGYSVILQEVTQGLSLPKPWNEEEDDQSSKGDILKKALVGTKYLFQTIVLLPVLPNLEQGWCYITFVLCYMPKNVWWKATLQLPTAFCQRASVTVRLITLKNARIFLELRW